jgi:hypothetical protein
MFPSMDPATTLELHRQKVDQMIREAADHKRARSAATGGVRRFGRWRRRPDGGRGSHVAATA